MRALDLPFNYWHQVINFLFVMLLQGLQFKVYFVQPLKVSKKISRNKWSHIF